MRTIKEWQKAAYALAVEKGFHDCRACEGKGGDRGLVIRACNTCKGTGRADPTSPTRIAARLALIHSEISEAVECVARGKMELYFEHKNGQQHATLDTIRKAVNNELVPLSPADRAKYKPEGFPVELADVFLRLCDLAESLGLELAGVDLSYRPECCDGSEDWNNPESIAAELNGLHIALSRAWNLYDSLEANADALGEFLDELVGIARACGVDLPAMAELKMEYNKTRPIRHGGKRL